MNKRLLAVPALGALLAFGAVGCGDDNSKQLNEWATKVCGAAKDPIAQAQTALADTGQVKTGETPVDLQKRLSADIARLAKTNQQLAEAIDQAGAPKVENGENLRKDTVAELNKAAEGYLEVQKKLDALSSADQSKFADGLRSVADQVQQLSSLSTQAQGKLQRGELGAAMAKQDGCKPGSATAAPTGGVGAAPSGAATGASGTASPAADATGAGGAPATTPAPTTPAGSAPAGTPAAAPSTPSAPSTPAPTAS